MNILLAGASGYAGHAVAGALRRSGHHVTALLRRPNAERAHSLLMQEVQVLAGDLREPDSYRAALAACDVFISTVMDFEDPVGTDRRLFDTMRHLPLGTDGTRRQFIYTTGCSIYGHVSERVVDETTPGNPAHPLHFRMELEQEALSLPNWRTAVVRPGFMFGLDARSCFATTWFEQAESGRVTYAGDVVKGWSWVHVSDLADAYCRLVAHAGLDQEVFCLADDFQPRSWDVAQAAAQAAGFTGPLTPGPAIMEDWSALLDHNQFMSSAKARQVLGWAPKQGGILADMRRCYQSWKTSQEADNPRQSANNSWL